MQDYYEILGVPRFSGDPQELRRAYKEQVLFFHPDKGNVNESIALERTQLLNEAYKTLKDPVKKADYDRDLKAFLQRESYAAPKKEEPKTKEEENPQPQKKPKSEKQEKQSEQPKQKATPKAKPAPAPAGDDSFLGSIKKAASRAIDIAPVLPKPILVGLAIVLLLFGLTLLDMLYRGVSSIIAPSEIDSGIFTSDELERELHSACIPFERYRSRIKDTCEFVESPDAGFGSKLFYASEKLIVMRRDDEPRPLTLVVDYTGSLGILLEQDTDAASIRFSENVWYDRATQLQVVAEHPGITVFTFGNDRNDISFRVRVIVL